MRPKVYLKKKEDKRIRKGHPWIFSNEIKNIDGLYNDGDPVNIYDYNNRFIATGYLNSKSLISVRILAREDIPLDKEFFRRRILSALNYRERVMGKRDAFRAVFAESDHLPGLIADKYGKYLVIQFLTMGIERFSKEIIEIFQEILAPEAIILRNDSPFRKLEGLKQEKKILGGNSQIEDLNKVIIYEDHLKFRVDLLEGQKTGFFLDQKDNRDYFSGLNLTGKGLDCFCYSGAWGIRGAERSLVTCLDSSAQAISLARFNGELNSLTENLIFEEEDVFKYLSSCIVKGETFDWINLDPPAFVKSKKKLKEAISGYRDINFRAMKLVKKGGFLITSSCSYNLKEENFIRILEESAKAAKRDIKIIYYGGQAKDHPVLIYMPESRYLKTIFLYIN